MRILRILAVVISAAVIITGSVLALTSRGKSDAPVITCSEASAIIATVNTTDEELLTYVKAYDKQDGDISDHIKVIRKNYFVQNKTTVVTFAVCDSDNNVSSLNRKLVLSDYYSPRISLSCDFVFPRGYLYNLSKYVAAEDVIDGDLTQFVKLISTEFTNVEGTYPINVKVSNSMGDITEMVINAIVTDRDYSEVKIRLNDYVLYSVVGEQIDYGSMVKDIYNKTATKYDVNDIVIDDSAVDMSTPGVYDVFYRIPGDGTGNEITMTRLIVVVTEE